jgi:hypothetical protein
MKKMLGSFPAGLAISFASPTYANKKTWPIQKQPRSSSQAPRRMKGHETTTIPLLSPLT